MKSFNRFILLWTLLTACACAKKESLNVRHWTNPHVKACEMRLASGLDSLPFAIATTFNRTDQIRYDALMSARPWSIGTDLKVTDLSEGLLDPDHDGQISLFVQAVSADGRTVYLNRLWEEPQHAMLEDALGGFRYDAQHYRLDIWRVGFEGGDAKNLTPTGDSPSYYNGGPTLNPADPNDLMFTAMIGPVSRLYRMNADGSDKRPMISTGGFAYGASASPNGRHYAFHSINGHYRVYVGDVATGRETEVRTPCNLNFGPRWSPDSKQIVFLCDNAYWAANADGSNAHLMGSRNGLRHEVPFFRGYDHHAGGTDRYEWTADSTAVVHSRVVGDSTELVRSKDGSFEQLTFSPPGSSVSHPLVKGDWVVYHANKANPRKMYDVFLLNLKTKEEIQVTDLEDNCNSRYVYF